MRCSGACTPTVASRLTGEHVQRYGRHCLAPKLAVAAEMYGKPFPSAAVYLNLRCALQVGKFYHLEDEDDSSRMLLAGLDFFAVRTSKQKHASR